MSNITDIILKQVKDKGKADSLCIARLCNISRQAAHRHLIGLVKLQKLFKVGKTRGSYYILYSKEEAKRIKKREETFRLKLENKNQQEDRVYDRIFYTLQPLKKSRKNVQDILRYAFTEMLNNAIEHSGSRYTNVSVTVSNDAVSFDVIDRGVGIFRHVQKKFKLSDEYEAVTEILKGKKTTMPSKHTGEGIFFTSKAADAFAIESSKISLFIDNKADDIFIKEIKNRKGTKVSFKINANARKVLRDIFLQYTDSDYEFSKTKVVVNLYHNNVEYTSRSQARRLVAGLDRFKEIVLDFKRVKTIGQGFADEIFRVFQSRNSQVSVETINCCKAVDFMIKRAKAQ